MTSLFDQIEGALHLGIEASTTLKAEEACANALTALQEFRKRIPDCGDVVRKAGKLTSSERDELRNFQGEIIDHGTLWRATSMLHEANGGE